MNLKRILLTNILILIILLLLILLRLDIYNVQDSTLIKPNTGLILTPIQYQRPLVSTLLTFPEWYLVYSSEEYSNFTAHHLANEFPFYTEIWQYWDSYYKSNQLAGQLRQNNIGDQVMLIVIGSSTTIEYFFRGLYERTIGTLSAILSGRVEEDNYANQVAEKYLIFIKKEPWYDFNYFGALKRLWLDNSFWGHGFFRKMERKYVLSTEYLIKGIYGQFIGVATHVSYGVADVDTALVTTQFPSNFSDPSIRILAKIKPDNTFLLVPRLDAFGQYARLLAAKNVGFKEIAGNNAFITLSVLVDKYWQLTCQQCAVLYKQTILTEPSKVRIMLIVPVAQLNTVLNCLAQQHVYIEHVYDY